MTHYPGSCKHNYHLKNTWGQTRTISIKILLVVNHNSYKIYPQIGAACILRHSKTLRLLEFLFHQTWIPRLQKSYLRTRAWQLICGHLPQNSVTISHYTASCHLGWQRTAENATFQLRRNPVGNKAKKCRTFRHLGRSCHEQKCMRI